MEVHAERKCDPIIVAELGERLIDSFARLLADDDAEKRAEKSEGHVNDAA